MKRPKILLSYRRIVAHPTLYRRAILGLGSRVWTSTSMIHSGERAQRVRLGGGFQRQSALKSSLNCTMFRTVLVSPAFQSTRSAAVHVLRPRFCSSKYDVGELKMMLKKGRSDLSSYISISSITIVSNSMECMSPRGRLQANAIVSCLCKEIAKILRITLSTTLFIAFQLVRSTSQA